MKKLLCALVALPFVSATALAQPVVHASGGLAQQPLLLSETQMDGVTAGWDLSEIDISNTSWTQIQVYTQIDPSCSSCYLDIDSPAINVDSKILGGLP